MGGIRGKVVAPIIMAVFTVGVVIFVFTSIISDSTVYTLKGTLPKMIADFGANARVVEIDVDREEKKDQHVLYEVIGADGQLHRRSYVLSESENHRGATNSGTYVRNAVRMPTGAELSGAQLHLGQVPPGVVDTLYRKVRFPSDSSHARLTGETWELSSGDGVDDRFSDRYEARYDGSNLRQTGPAPSSAAGTTSSGSPPAPAPATTTPGSSTLQHAQTLLGCVQAAHQDVTKLAACERRFKP